MGSTIRCSSFPLFGAAKLVLNFQFLLALLPLFGSAVAYSQQASLQNGLLSLPYIVSNETAYSAELSLISDTDPVQFELLAAIPAQVADNIVASSFTDNRLFVPDIDIEGFAYWAELLLITEQNSVPVRFELSQFGLHAAIISQNLLGIDNEPQWQRLPGSASDIGVGADGSVWAIGTDERGGGFGIYHWVAGSWQRVDGGAIRIDVDPGGTPWIVNNTHNIYRRVHNSWLRVAGEARDIGIGADGTVWVTSGGGTYRYDNGDWLGVRGSGVRIDVDPSGIPWVIDHTDDIHQLIAGRWLRRPGEARDIGIGADGSVWIIGTSGDDGGHGIYRWTGNAWNRVIGSSRQISVGPDGYPWAANSDGDIYRAQ